MAQIPSITPLLRYRDVRGAADWLCQAFGFSEHDIQKEADDTINYVILNLADRFVLVAPSGGEAFKSLLVQPEETNWASTQTCYVTVDDIEAHFARAQAAGAQIDAEIEEDGFGGRYYFCRVSETVNMQAFPCPSSFLDVTGNFIRQSSALPL